MRNAIVALFTLFLVLGLSVTLKRVKVAKDEESCLSTRSFALKLEPKPKNLFIPQCTLAGNYLKQQCDSENNICWCVDNTGKSITGTMVLGARPTACRMSWIERWYQRLQT